MNLFCRLILFILLCLSFHGFAQTNVDSTEFIPEYYESEDGELYYFHLRKEYRNGKYGLVNTKGEVILPFEYDYLNKISRTIEVGRATINGKLIGSPEGLNIPADTFVAKPIIHIPAYLIPHDYIGYQGRKDTTAVLIDLEGSVVNNRNIVTIDSVTNLHLEEIPPPLNGYIICNKPEIVKEIQINGKGSKELLIRRVCHGSLIRISHYFADLHSFSLEKYEIWDIDSQTKIFEDTTHFTEYQSYSTIHAHALFPSGSYCETLYHSKLTLDEYGTISIVDVKYEYKGTVPPRIIPLMASYHFQGIYSVATSKSISYSGFAEHPDPRFKGECTYVFKGGTYLKQ